MTKDIQIVETMTGNGKKKRKVVYKEMKYTIPKLRTDRKTGRKYIFLKRKKIYVEDDISERQLIKFIISQLAPSKRARKKKEKRSPVFPKGPSVVNVSSIPNALNDRKVADIKDEVSNLKLLMQNGKKSSLPALSQTSVPIPQIESSTSIPKMEYPVSKDELRAKFKSLHINKPEIAKICSETFGNGRTKSAWMGLSIDEMISKLAAINYEPREEVKIEDVKEDVKEDDKKDEEKPEKKSRKIQRQAEIIFEDPEDQEEHLKDNNARINQVLNMKKRELQQTIKDMGGRFGLLTEDEMRKKILRDEFGKELIPVGDDGFYNIGDGKAKIPSDNGLNTLQIDKIMKPLPEFLGTIPSDGIDSLIPLVKPNTRICFIMNSDPHNEPGSHWVAVLIDARKDGDHSIEFYNSLGMYDRRRLTSGFLRDIVPLLEKLNPEEKPLKLKENLIADQNNTSSNCGYFAIKFLLDRIKRNETFAEATRFDSRGEEMIQKFKDEFYPFRTITQNGRGLLSAIKRGYQYVKGKIVKVVNDKIEDMKSNFNDVLQNGLRTNLPPSARRLLESNGNEVITDIMVCRLPIKSIISKVLDWFSNNQFSQNLRDLGYDNAFHLFMKIRTNRGSYICEKNQVVKLQSEGWESGDGGKAETEKMSVSVKPGITLNLLFENAFKKYGEEKITRYDSRNNNCQAFVNDLLTASNMMTDSIKKFVMQDAEAIYKGLGLLGVANKVVTDVAAVGDQVLNGRGKKRH